MTPLLDADAAARIASCLNLPLTQEQQEAVFAAVAGPRVVVAGAGSGKTAIMAARMVAVAAAGVPVEAILGLTFTRKAAAELAERVRSSLRLARTEGLVPADSGQPDISTYHSFAQRLVRDSGLFAGIDPDLRIESEFTLLPLAADVVASSAHLAGDHQMQLRTAVRAMRKLDEECAEHEISPAQVRTMEASRLAGLRTYAKLSGRINDVITASQQRIVLTHVVEEYREAKHRAGVMDFADMLRLAHRAASHDAVRAHVAEQFQVVLLDEYQDTSVVQRMLLQQLFGQGHPVVAVGDPKQSIYGFRGAASANIEQFPEHFRHTDGTTPATVYPLSVNFRSAPEIVELANLSEAAGRAEAAGLMGSTLVSGRGDATGRVDVAVYRTQDDETRALIRSISFEVERGTKAEDILVLVRTNGEAARLTTALQRAGIPASSSDDLAIFDLPEIQDLLAALAVAADPNANLEAVRLLAGPRWRVGLRDLNALGGQARMTGPVVATSDEDDPSQPAADVHSGLIAAVADADPVATPSMIDAVVALARQRHKSTRLSAEAGSRIDEFAEEYREASRLTGEPVTDQLVRLMQTTGMDAELLLGPNAPAHVAAVESLLDAAGQYQAAHPSGGVIGFLRAIRLAREFDVDPGFEPPSATGVVRVLTVHKAKGLQADVVYLPGFTKNAYDDVRVDNHWSTHPGRLPDELRGDRAAFPDDISGVIRHDGALVPLAARNIDDLKAVERQAQEEEAARLVYVGITRARDRLVLTAHTWAAGKVNARMPSRHLAALRDLPGVHTGPWHEPAEGETNPVEVDDLALAFPHQIPEIAEQRVRDAALVWSHMARLQATQASAEDGPDLHPDLHPDLQESDAAQRALLRAWDADIAALRRERDSVASTALAVELPGTLSVTGLQQLVATPEAYARARRRPMPQRPSRVADLGTRFHEWVAQRWEQRPLWAAEEFAADAEVDRMGDEALQQLIDNFESSEFAHRRPHAVEVPFTVTIAGLPVTGRIDAVFEQPDGSWLVVDWKTSVRAQADDVQLAVYRIAWAKAQGVPVDHVVAAFFYVARNELVVFEELLSEEELRDQLVAAVTTD